MNNTDKILYTALTLSLMILAVSVGYFIGDDRPSGRSISPISEPVEFMIEVVEYPLYFVEEVIDTTLLDHWEKEDLKKELKVEWYEDMEDEITRLIPIYGKDGKDD